MTDITIENPIINSPYNEPTRHFKFGEEGITDEIVDGRRISSYLVPIAKPRKRGSKQLMTNCGGSSSRSKSNSGRLTRSTEGVWSAKFIPGTRVLRTAFPSGRRPVGFKEDRL
ncbi:hypothetical protein J7M28_05905 [bacterium]|nr:hypothetical protein [bacterium]